MQARTKEPITGEFARISVLVPKAKAGQASEAIAKFLALAGVQATIDPEADDLLDLHEAFPDMGPKDVLSGSRLLAEMTQAELAQAAGIKRHHVSEMEHGRRTISPEMARRLAKALNIDYRTLL